MPSCLVVVHSQELNELWVMWQQPRQGTALLAFTLQLQLHWTETVLSKLGGIKTWTISCHFHLLGTQLPFPCPISTEDRLQSLHVRRMGSDPREGHLWAWLGLGLQAVRLEPGSLLQVLSSASLSGSSFPATFLYARLYQNAPKIIQWYFPMWFS